MLQGHGADVKACLILFPAGIKLSEPLLCDSCIFSLVATSTFFISFLLFKAVKLVFLAVLGVSGGASLFIELIAKLLGVW